MEPWHVWVIVALILVIVEVFTSGFAVVCVAFGALWGAVASAFTDDVRFQILWFAIGSALALVAIRPLLLKWAKKRSSGREQATNVDALIGREAIVRETVDNSKGGGRVMVDGDNWKAVSEHDEEVFEPGEKVTVVKFESVILTVKKHK